MAFKQISPYIFQILDNPNIEILFDDCFWLFNDSCTSCHKVFELKFTGFTKNDFNRSDFLEDINQIISAFMKDDRFKGILLRIDQIHDLCDCILSCANNLEPVLIDFELYINQLNVPARDIKVYLFVKSNYLEKRELINEFMRQCYFCPPVGPGGGVNSNHC